MDIWFMYSNHTFARANTFQARQFFDEDGCGGLFVHDELGVRINSLTLQGHKLAGGKYGVTDDDINSWVDAIAAEISFRKAMIA
jgi:hypothetical protein